MKYLWIILIITITTQICLSTGKRGIKDKIEALKNRAKQMYGSVKNAGKKQWEFETGDQLTYPRGDKQKLSEIASQWSTYYDCTTLLLTTLTSTKKLPSIYLVAYRGGVARLPCNICISPEDVDKVEWMYTETLEKKFLPLEDKETVIQEDDGNLTIYRAELHDAGLYHCHVGASVGNTVFFEVISDDVNITVVKPSTSRGPYAQPSKRLSPDGLTLLTWWGPWSECSRCGKVGRRRRFGPRYVAMLNASDGMTEEDNDSELELENEELKLFNAFPGGIPYQSQYLPWTISNETAVKDSYHEIMIGLCKVRCKDSEIFEVRTRDGRVIERANNSAGEYSLLQKLPPQPPPTARDIVFAKRLQRLVLACPGTTLRDIPATWKIGTLEVVPRDLDASSGGRLHITARDQLAIDSVRYTDTNLYSCWEDGNLAGVVKLEVWQGSELHWTQHAALLAMLLVAGVVLRVTFQVLHNKRRKLRLL